MGFVVPDHLIRLVMNRTAFFSLAFTGLLLLATGCASTSSTEPGASGTADGEETSSRRTSALQVKNATVFIDGDQKGVTPATLQVRRGFGEMQVSLRIAGNVVRTFEVEPVYTSNSGSMRYGYWANQFGSTTSFDVQTLPKMDDDVYAIPYFDRPITIEDREYALTLIVQN